MTHLQRAAERLLPWVPALLFGAGALSAVITRATIPITWDSIQFSLAVQRFDVALHQPHPPGYFLFVLVARTLSPLLGDPHTALVAEAALVGGAAAVLLYLCGRTLFGTSIGLTAAALGLSSATVWGARGMGETYIISAAASPLIGMLCWRMLRERHFPWWPAPLALGLVAGFRPTDALFLTPLWLWALRGRGIGAALYSALLGAVVVAAWALPMLRATGGLAAFYEANRLLNENWVVVNSPLRQGWRAVGWNLDRLGQGLALGGSPSLLLAAAYLVARLAKPRGLNVERLIFFALWVLPALAFFAFVHVGRFGYTLIVLPALLVLSSAAVWQLARRTPDPRLVGASLTALLVAYNCVFFFLGVMPLRRAHERWCRELAAVGREVGGPETLFVCAMTEPYSRESAQSRGPAFRMVGYYIPQSWTIYVPPDRCMWRGQAWNAMRGRQTYALPIPATFTGIRTIAFWDRPLLRVLTAGARLRERRGPDGMVMYILECDPSRPVTVGPGERLRYTRSDR